GTVARGPSFNEPVFLTREGFTMSIENAAESISGPNHGLNQTPAPRAARYSTKSIKRLISLAVSMLFGILIGIAAVDDGGAQDSGSFQGQAKKIKGFDAEITENSERMLEEGKSTFRFDTFGDESFWGDTLRLHQAIEGSGLGGVGPGVSPKTALDLGLKV